MNIRFVTKKSDLEALLLFLEHQYQLVPFYLGWGDFCLPTWYLDLQLLLLRSTAFKWQTDHLFRTCHARWYVVRWNKFWNKIHPMGRVVP